MSQSFWNRLFTSLFTRARRREAGLPPRQAFLTTYRPRMEALEDRVVPALALTYLGTGTGLTLS